MTPSDIEREYSVTEISQLMQVSKQTVRNWISQGRLTAYKHGERNSKFRITKSSFSAFLEGRAL